MSRRLTIGLMLLFNIYFEVIDTTGRTLIVLGPAEDLKRARQIAQII